MKAAIYGAGGHARVVASIAKANHYSVVGFFDDSYSGKEELIHGSPVIGEYHDIITYKNQVDAVFLAIGDNERRKEAYYYLKKHSFWLPALVHPQANIESDAVVGEGSVVCLGANLCTETVVGKGCIVNTACSVDHESVIGDFVQLAPQTVVAGRTTIGDLTFVGLNACIADKISIGSKVIIGAGAVILRDVPDGLKVFGIYH